MDDTNDSGVVLVTGATGFLGRRITARLASEGHTVLGVSRGTRAPLETRERVRHEALDINDHEALRAIFARNRVHTVVHLAGIVHASAGAFTWQDYDHANHVTSRVLFESAVAHGVKRIVFASTIEVYGPQHGTVDETSTCRPESDYAKTKWLAERALEETAARGPVRFASLRFAPVYGPEFRRNLDRRIYLVAPRVGYLIGRGDYALSLCSVRNAEQFVSAWITEESAPSGVFNVADTRAYPAREILALERAQGRAKLTVRIPRVPALIALACIETAFSIAGRPAGMLSTYNLRKLARSTTWDNRKARHVTDLPWTLENSF